MAILEYLEDGWLGRAQNRVQGVIFTYDPESDIKPQKIKDVPVDKIIARVQGSWTDKIYYTLGDTAFDLVPETDKHQIIDLNPLFPVPKTVPPMEKQLANESQRFWKDVTIAIKSKQYALATKLKIQIEDRQRAKAAERKEQDKEWQPRFFTGAVTPVGKPELTEDGETAIKGLHEDKWDLEENKELGA
jgi:oxysterol-binding protein-related protein 9/10/11